jgi:ferredoxin-NADP reductase
MYVDRASFGFLTTAGFAPGLDLWMIATGTGLAPFLSILQESAIWQDYENLVVVHSVRQAAELAYRETIEAMIKTPPFGASRARLHYVPIVTRSSETLYLHERIPALLANAAACSCAAIRRWSRKCARCSEHKATQRRAGKSPAHFASRTTGDSRVCSMARVWGWRAARMRSGLSPR